MYMHLMLSRSKPGVGSAVAFDPPAIMGALGSNVLPEIRTRLLELQVCRRPHIRCSDRVSAVRFVGVVSLPK